MDTVTSAVNKTIYDSITTYTNSLIENGLLNCDFDTAISHFTTTTIKKKKSKPDVIKSLPMWTPHHFDTCIALVGDCMAQCSLSKTQGQFCTACSKKCGDDGIPPNGTIFTRTSYQYTAPNGKSPKPFIESTIYKKKIRDGESPAQIKQYYDDLHFDISPLNWGKGALLDPLSDDKVELPNKSASEKPSKSAVKSMKTATEKAPEKEPEKAPEKAEKKKTPAKAEKPDQKPDQKPSKKSIKSIMNNDDELTSENPDIPELPNSVEWSFQGHDYLAINLPGGDKNIYDPISHEHIGIFNSRSQRIIRY